MLQNYLNKVMNTIEASELLDILPHRYPFVMIDRVLDYDNHKIIAVKNYTVNEPYSMAHFPGNPIMPGVFQIEAMAQASTVLAFKYFENVLLGSDEMRFFKGGGILFAEANEVKFKKIIRPGDQLLVYSSLTRQRRNIFEFTCTIEVGDEVMSEGKFKALAGLN